MKCIMLFNPLMLGSAKSAWQNLRNPSGKSILKKIFEREIVIDTLPTTLSNMFSYIFNSKIFSKVLSIQTTIT